MLIDTNVNLGSWPFNLTPARTAAQLAKHLAASGIERALVSHFDTAFQPDPMPANRTLLAAVKRTPALRPVPVINLRLANWAEQLAECVAAKVSAVKLLPNFHNYTLRAPAVRLFMDALSATPLRLILNIRFEDERHRYFAFNVQGVPMADVKAFLKKFPQHHVLLTGIYRPEIKDLAKTRKNFSADLAYCEWRDTVKDLLTALPASRLMLGTCTPMLATRGQVDKLRLASIPAKSKALIASGNAVKFFRL